MAHMPRWTRESKALRLFPSPVFKDGWRSAHSMLNQTPEFVARGLARAWLSTPWNRRNLLRVGRRVTDLSPSVLRGLVDRVLAQYPGDRPPPRFVPLVCALRGDKVFGYAPSSTRKGRRLRVHATRSPPMQPGRAAREWEVPAIQTARELADFLGVGLTTLEGWADAQDRSTHLPDALLHYERYWRGDRLIEAPKAQLARMQRQVLRRIVDRIPPHPSAHGFVKRCSIVSHARGHLSQPVVLRCDLRRFFNTIRRPRVQGIFHYAGYPEPVAHLLASLCTTRTPARLLRQRRDRTHWVLLERHLPQGAPTSPGLANLVAHALDRRLTGLADRNGLAYSRYADDLTFSGGQHLRRSSLLTHIRAIVSDEGFSLNESKTRYYGQGRQQRVTGITVNARPNVQRAEFDRLKAILHNCWVHGPESQNRFDVADFRTHLEGRVAFVAMINPQKARRLRRLLAQIEW